MTKINIGSEAKLYNTLQIIPVMMSLRGSASHVNLDPITKKPPKQSRTRIVAKIEAMKDNLQGDVKQLKNFTPSYRLRVGNYRILFEVEKNTLVIYRVKHRQNAYT